MQVDKQDHWAAGNATVVQVGDQLDRGGEELAILLLLERMKHEAEAAGGAFYSINGNHETMSVQGNFRYADRAAAADFDRWRHYYKMGQRLKRKCGLDAPPVPAPLPNTYNIPHEMESRWQALQPGGPITRRFFATQNTVLTVGDSVFVHGGLLPRHVKYGLEKINAETAQWMSAVPKDPDDAKRNVPKFLRGRNALVWSRHFSSTKEDCQCELLEEVLGMVGASRMVVGYVSSNALIPCILGRSLQKKYSIPLHTAYSPLSFSISRISPSLARFLFLRPLS